MESFGNKRVIQQGESWNLDIKLSQSQNEYIPYIIGKRENPHFVITVASTKYEKNNRYVESWWLKIPEDITPTFIQTVPQYIGELSYIPTTISDISDKIINENGTYDEPLSCLYQYKLSGEKEYRYCYYTQANPNTSTSLIHSYECNIKFNLTTGEINKTKGTGEWGSQNYMYQITLVSGQEMVDTLIDAKKSYPELDWRNDWPVEIENEAYEEYRDRVLTWLSSTVNDDAVQKDVFNFIKARKPDYFQADIDWDSPLGRIWCPEPILTPTTLQVNNNLRTLI